MTARNLACYLPVRKRTRLQGGRRAVVEQPLFPGYAFLWGTSEQAYWADRTRRVAHILPVVDQQRFEWELRNIALALDREAVLEPYPELVRGGRVEVRSGPLRGLQGVIQERRKNNRLILQVQMLAQALSLDIEGASLSLVE
jgi:transcription antitermination factor NusG